MGCVSMQTACARRTTAGFRHRTIPSRTKAPESSEAVSTFWSFTLPRGCPAPDRSLLPARQNRMGRPYL